MSGLITKKIFINKKYFVDNNSGEPYVMREYNSVSINIQQSEDNEIWISGKIIWDTPLVKLLKTGTFKQESWLNYKDFIEKNNSDKENNRRLSIQLELTD